MMLLALALAATPAPAKLVILFNAQAITVTDYPSMERCEVAKANLIAQVRAHTEQQTPPGYKVVLLGVTAYCIPA